MAKNSVIGKFKGKCCDADAVNNNGMLLDDELFQNLINSEEYKTAMKNRYYIGYLGHPEDPNCMDFKNACIVMTDMYMDDNKEIQGEFDLIDTPVGRIVKSFIDAGVVFGISIRGAGDLDGSGRVDPDTFVFRGYDLVTFPAYNDAVPEFQAIAASTDVVKQKKYQNVCKSVKENISKITSCEAIEIIQSQFNPVSDEYEVLEDRISDLTQEDNCCTEVSILQEKLDAMTQLYMKEVERVNEFREQVNELTSKLYDVNCSSRRKMATLKKISASQIEKRDRYISSLENKCKKFEGKYQTAIRANSKLKSENLQYITASSKTDKELAIIHDQLDEMDSKNTKLRSKVQASSQDNLKYMKKIESMEDAIEKKDATISDLKDKISETVANSAKVDQKSLNLGEKVDELETQIEASTQLVQAYQQAYADMCANAIGTRVDNISITCATTPDELKKLIFGSTSTSGICTAVDETECVELGDDFDDDDTFVTL